MLRRGLLRIDPLPRDGALDLLSLWGVRRNLDGELLELVFVHPGVAFGAQLLGWRHGGLLRVQRSGVVALSARRQPAFLEGAAERAPGGAADHRPGGAAKHCTADRAGEAEERRPDAAATTTRTSSSSRRRGGLRRGNCRDDRAARITHQVRDHVDGHVRDAGVDVEGFAGDTAGGEADAATVLARQRNVSRSWPACHQSRSPGPGLNTPPTPSE